MAKQQNQPQVKESAPVEYKGNDIISATGQKTYADIKKRMETRPELEKLMLGQDWTRINAVISFLILEELEKRW